ncbi:MAG: polysaccharide deacetylase family protein [Candidatus Krumholzibacteriia bacterium]|nr:polysaccharide deacetylase family protein [bacterium]MCB9513481.1 polysaccharide deacetylase family protein [Candidatus Latescibacterota bacterium]MCB9516193.1 polysaccharide deacetylase family protein [Candidatus Latescibacterota bacterium]
MPQDIRGDGGREPVIAFFRNDDVNELTPELIALSELFFAAEIPIIHAVEPGNVTDDCVDWLLEKKAQHGRLLEIMQHGYNHTKHYDGEFGGKRGYREQYEDLKRGQDIMDARFGDQWFSAMNFPYGPYNQDAIRAVDALGYKVFNGHYNPRRSRRLFYALGRLMGKGQIMNRHISHHLEIYPGTSTFTIDMAITYIDSYYGHYGSQECTFFSVDELMQRFEEAKRHINAIGWLLHHRYHNSEASLRLVQDTIDAVRKSDPAIEFWNFEEIHAAYAPGASVRRAG